MAGNGKLGLITAPPPAAGPVALPAPQPRPVVPLGQSRGTYVPRGASAPGAAPAPAQGGGGGGFLDGLLSIPSQFGHALLSIPQGIAHLGVGAAEEVASIPRVVIDYAKGDINGRQALTGLTGHNFIGDQQQADALGAKYHPLATELGQSFERTVGDIAHPTHFARALKQGQIVNKVLEDAGNVSIVAGPVAKMLGAYAAGTGEAAGAAARAAGVAERVAKLGGETANAPVSVLRGGLNLAKDTALKYLDQTALAEHMPTAFTEVGRNIYQGLKAGDFKMRRQVQHAINDVAATLNKQGVSDPEFGAAVALTNGVGQMDKTIAERGNLTPDEARALHVKNDLTGQSYTPEMQQITHDYLNGTLDEATKARIDAARQLIERKMQEVTSAALEGRGRLKGNLDPAYLGNDAIDNNVMLNMIDNGAPAELLDAVQQRRTAGQDWASIERDLQNPELTAALDTASSYPTAWRPSMEAALNARANGVDVPLRPEDQLAAGMEQPKYLPGGNSEKVRPIKGRTIDQRLNVGTYGVQGVSSENMRGIGSIQPYSPLAFIDHLQKAIRRTESNAALIDTLHNAGLQNVGDVLPPEVLDQLRQQADQEAAAQFAGKQQARSEANRRFGQLVVERLREQGRGFEVLQGDLNNPQVGDFNPGAPVDYRGIGPDTTVLPTGLKGKLEQRTAPPNAILRTIEEGNSLFKRNTLPFRASWQLGDLMGGGYMGWIGGGIDPVHMWTSMRRLKANAPEAVGNFEKYVTEHPSFVEEGMNAQASDILNGGRGVGGREARTRVGAAYDTARNKSFQLNRTINAFNRHSYVLERLDRVLKQNGLGSVADLGGDSANWQRPEVQAAINTAIEDANKVMGTFSELTPVEQRYLRPMFTFYPWLRHITGLALRTAIDNPARMMWAARVGALGQQDQGQVPGYMQGSVGVGSSLIPLSFLNPFNDVVSGSPITNPGKALSPVIKFAGAVGPGLNFNKGLAPLTRPFGSGNIGDNGKPVAMTTLLNRPVEALYQAAKLFPVANNLMGLAPTWNLPGGVGLGPHPRYDNGGLITGKTGQPIATNSRLKIGLGLIGTPQWQDKQTAAAIAAKSGTNAKRTRRAGRHVRIGLP